MSKFLIMFILLSSLLLVFLKHPLSLGLILLIQTTLVALTTGIMNFNYWFSYILFLIMIGGMIILFIYMTSIASNEKFSLSLRLLALILLSVLILTITLLLDSMPTNLYMTQDLFDQTFMLNFKMSFTKYMNWNMLNIFLLIIIYLLITLIMVVKITTIQYGPLRQKF